MPGNLGKQHSEDLQHLPTLQGADDKVSATSPGSWYRDLRILEIENVVYSEWYDLIAKEKPKAPNKARYHDDSSDGEGDLASNAQRIRGQRVTRSPQRLLR